MRKKIIDTIKTTIVYVLWSLFFAFLGLVVTIIVLYFAFFWPSPTIRINNNTSIEIEALSLYIQRIHPYARHPDMPYAFRAGNIAPDTRVRSRLQNSQIPSYNRVFIIIQVNGRESWHILFTDDGVSYQRFGSVRIDMREDNDGLIYLDMSCRVHIGFRYTNRSAIPTS